MKSPYYKPTTDKITEIKIIVKRGDGADTEVVFFREDKIKDLIENEPFFRDLVTPKEDK